jgi:glycosyltransferase involved in cell wall biosynthesis
MSDKLMSIMVLNWNRLHYTKQTVERILNATKVPHELIFIDNNSTEESGVRQYLRKVKGNHLTRDIKYVFNDRNFGVGGGRNTGLLVAEGDYLVNIDDDVLVPNRWDVLMKEACDKVPKLGLTGINVEPFNFPVKVVNGVRMRPKAGNLGGACLCLPRRTFKCLGFYMYDNIYGMEDVEMKCRLDLMGLVSAYVEPDGKHIDNDSLKAYRSKKNDAHTGGSIQLGALAQFRRKLQAQLKDTGSLYVPFRREDFNPVDKEIFVNDLIKKG